MKRLLNCVSSEIAGMTKDDLLTSVKENSGRTILAENDVAISPFANNITNSEIVAGFGADLILLNSLDLDNIKIIGLRDSKNPILDLKKLTGRPIGMNLEPVDFDTEMAIKRVNISSGRLAKENNLKLAQSLGMDFICLTGNPATGVSNKEICSAIKLAKKHFHGVIMAGKMHSSGINEDIINKDTISSFVKAGADVILLPVSGTVPGFSEDEMREAVKHVHSHKKLAMSTIGTTQEGADEFTIRTLALTSKRAGVDIQHIGDSGFNGTADPENIVALSIAIRGKRHTYLKMAQSINR